MNARLREWLAEWLYGIAERISRFAGRIEPPYPPRLGPTVLHPLDWEDITLPTLPDGTVLWGSPADVPEAL